MAHEDKSQQVASWLGTAAGIVGTVVTILATYKISFGQITNRAWTLTALGEAVLVGVMGLYLLRHRVVRLPRGIRARNRALLESTMRVITADLERQLHELRNARITLYGLQVRRAQIHLLQAWQCYKGDRVIYATDLVGSVDVLRTRGEYFTANKHFIRDGGRIERIFLVQAVALESRAFVSALDSMMRDHEAIGVDVMLHITDVMASEYRQDFVLFSSDCVLVEQEQADEAFLGGRMACYFDATTLDLYAARYNHIRGGPDAQPARETLRLFRSLLCDAPADVDLKPRVDRLLVEIR